MHLQQIVGTTSPFDCSTKRGLEFLKMVEPEAARAVTMEKDRERGRDKIKKKM